MTEKELWEYIDELKERGSVYGLTNEKRLLERMGNPEKKLRFVHVAGTNGKGTTAFLIAEICRAAGITVGLYTSPDICDYRDKIRVNNRLITKKALLEGMQYIKKILQDCDFYPTLFEIETALAFWYFEKMNCRLVVLEAGLGGTDDATNVIEKPLVAVITSISMDHMALLGNDIMEIAANKAGIIKDNCRTVILPQDDTIINLFRNKTAKLTVAPCPQRIKTGAAKTSFSYQGDNNFEKLELGLLGSYQPANACVSIRVIEELIREGFNIGEKSIRKALKDASWPGRFSIIADKPLIIMDGAHNEGAALALKQSVDDYFKDKPLVYIMGVLRDKEYEKVMEIMAGRAVAIVTLTPPSNIRALPGLELAKAAKKYCSNVTTADSVEEALEIAEILAGKKCAILAFGSLSYLGRLKNAVSKREKGRKNGRR